MKRFEIIKGVLAGLLIFIGFGSVYAGGLQPIEMLPDSKWDEKCKVVIKFDVPVYVYRNAVISIYDSEGATYKGKLILSPDDPTGKTVVARFPVAIGDDEVDYLYQWRGGSSYTFTVEAGQICAKGNSDLTNDKIEWTLDRWLPAGICNMAGQKMSELNVGDLVFEWQGEENAIQSSSSPVLYIGMIHTLGGYQVPTCSRRYKCRMESDTINHIYRVIPMINEDIPHEPYVLNLLEDITYELVIFGIVSKKNPAIPFDDETPAHIEGLYPYDPECFEGIYPEKGFFEAPDFEDDEVRYLSKIFISFNTDITPFTTYSIPYNLYVDDVCHECEVIVGSNGSKWIVTPWNLATFIEYKEYSVYEFEIPAGLITTPTGQMYYIKTTRVPLNLQSGIRGVSSEDRRELPVYDLYGRRVENPVPGNIYIRGGKKFVMR